MNEIDQFDQRLQTHIEHDEQTDRLFLEKFDKMIERLESMDKNFLNTLLAVKDSYAVRITEIALEQARQYNDIKWLMRLGYFGVVNFIGFIVLGVQLFLK